MWQTLRRKQSRSIIIIIIIVITCIVIITIIISKRVWVINKSSRCDRKRRCWNYRGSKSRNRRSWRGRLRRRVTKEGTWMERISIRQKWSIFMIWWRMSFKWRAIRCLITRVIMSYKCLKKCLCLEIIPLCLLLRSSKLSWTVFKRCIQYIYI